MISPLPRRILRRICCTERFKPRESSEGASSPNPKPGIFPSEVRVELVMEVSIKLPRGRMLATPRGILEEPGLAPGGDNELPAVLKGSREDSCKESKALILDCG